MVIIFLILFMSELLEENSETYQVLFKFLNLQKTNFTVSKQIFFLIYIFYMIGKTLREAYWFLYLKLYLSNHQHHQLHFSFSFFF